MSTPTIHCLKVTPEFFPAIACGDKNFEVRVNDRDFKAGDVLVLQEWDNGYTREAVTKTVTYTLYGGRFGVQEGYVVMGLVDYVKPRSELNQCPHCHNYHEPHCASQSDAGSKHD